MDSIVTTGAVLIVRLESAEEALAVSRAAVEGGIRALEITLSVPDALGVIRTLAHEYEGQGIAVGAGTVLDEAAAFACIQAGARLLVSPNVTVGMIRAAHRYGAVAIPGAYTPTEVVAALEEGADFVKVFPTESLGPSHLKAIKAPLPQAELLPAGGATPENVGEWFAAGASAVGVGSSITKAARADGDYSRVTRAAKDMLSAIAAARA
ncbi:bifunctional 4-hydroxy-2-oxoglutarate aldolase/2-dehydro-3-deoxy-phosphogluconate aldolase [Sinomonas sp. ASV322]|uniref:bifunctional 4-hydroxy-2-oxoglutarate aldolase/2-dehydro-3-deoxy-phosphogluconate aldolase n=1 Tax=Sinomonas sp. ASV322 TaxID=3041920 RepID=UPI0027DBB708|nr:bifunctional 4-hydroxy-2-oxoglutarate aldolase/2-dehydro-3-deoxy-phosphogluconate aldolase [Sinomonas sp. ASV322]MDQ4503574.1 bifunctional 4-hydroxy-2-oxoglutarate aldolase/2-dehydro-3-deoxy-phosphogluconate aldolase [Sinomonas sp. ASV322]